MLLVGIARTKRSKIDVKVWRISKEKKILIQVLKSQAVDEEIRLIKANGASIINKQIMIYLNEYDNNIFSNPNTIKEWINPEKDIKLLTPSDSKDVMILILWISVAKEELVFDIVVPISWTEEVIISFK